MCALWKGARYWRKRDHEFVDRDDLDKKNKNRTVHRISRTARAPFTRVEVSTVRTMPFRKNLRLR